MTGPEKPQPEGLERQGNSGRLLVEWSLVKLQIIYASGSGHTQYVVETLQAFLKKHRPDLEIRITRAEQAQAGYLTSGDILILASGTWNTDGIEGQLHPFMHEFLTERATGADLTGKAVTCISLGDDRYYFTTRCTEHFLRFIREHGMRQVVPPLIIVNEPYGQENKVESWAEKLTRSMNVKGHVASG